MSDNNSIIGSAKLRPEINGMPDGGLPGPKLRVELFEEAKPDSAWISELRILGDLPWHEGEERKIEIRIMSDEFRDYVITKRPNLSIRYGSQTIGRLELE